MNISNQQIFDNFDGRKLVSLVQYWKPLKDNIIPPPVANSLDLSSASLCPNKCYFCNVKWSDKTTGGHMTDETFEQILKIYKDMDIKSSCIAGGGESLANPRSEQYLQDIINKTNTQIGIITNGRIYRKIPKECRFINVSINAADAHTYSKMSGIDSQYFDRVCNNIKSWVQEKHNVTYKVMITNVNKSPKLLIDTVHIANKLGVQTVLFRFAMLPWDKVNNKNMPEYISLTDEEADLYQAQIKILKKYYPNINIIMPLERYDRCSRKFIPTECSGGMINFVTLWNGDCYLCSDFRTNPNMKLCHISEFQQFWGSQKHKDILSKIDVTKCPRCSFYLHNQIINEFVYNDVSNQYFI